MTRQDAQDKVTCYDCRGNRKTHGNVQRYVSPTTGACRRLVVQSVDPSGPWERRIEDHTNQQSKIALWLYSTNPFVGWAVFFEWLRKWLRFSLRLLWPVILFAIRLYYLNVLPSEDGCEKDSAAYSTGYYKPYLRSFRHQFWAARSSKEYSTRIKGDNERNIPTHSLYPRTLIIHDPVGDQWSPCTDPITIIHTKFVAVSYSAADVYAQRDGADKEREKQDFIQEVREAIVQQEFNAYWLDLECLSTDPEEKKMDLYCMADVYRGAEITLIILGDPSDDAWKRWGGRVWTFPETLLSQRLYYKFRQRNEIQPASLRQLANLAYSKYDSEKAIINAYTGKDPLERLERLTLLKSAIWRRGITLPSLESIPSTSASSEHDLGDRIPHAVGPHPADRVYALMGFFEHRIQPDYFEDELGALARLSMANDNDHIVDRMISLLPHQTGPATRWYADDDVYGANLWDVQPEIQVAGVTKNGAVVLDGCKAASIRWKDFPHVVFANPDSVRRTVARFICHLSWPCIIAGVVVCRTTIVGGIALLVCGSVLLLLSPWMYVFSESGRVTDPQPWLIGVKGVLDIDKAAIHLYGGGVIGRYRRLDYTPSGSEFAVPEQGLFRSGSRAQYDRALEAARGPQAGRMYTLIDTRSSTIYYFAADRPPTVCLFTGREGGLGRFVLCSERCSVDELHKETVLRMPTHISQRMELCDWVAIG